MYNNGHISKGRGYIMNTIEGKELNLSDGKESKEDAYIASSIVKYKEMDYEH